MDFFKLISRENVGKTFHIKFLPAIGSDDIIDNYPVPFGKYHKQIYVSNAMVNGEFKQLVYNQVMRDFLQIFFLGTRGYIIHPDPEKLDCDITYNHHRINTTLENVYLDLENRYDVTRDELIYVDYPDNVHPFNILYPANNEYIINPYSFKLTVREITLFGTSGLLDLGKIETVKYDPNLIIKDQSDSTINEANDFMKSKPSLEGLAKYYVEAYHRDKFIDDVLEG